MMKTKQTKIVATLGPASNEPKTIAAMIKAGMNVARINFSHGDHKEHGARIDNARAAAEQVKAPLAILQDLCGPKIRIGDFEDGAVQLKKGKRFTITTRKVTGTDEIVSVNYKPLPKEVAPKMQIMLEDGNFILEVVRVEDETDIVTKVVSGGRVRSRRGVNVPGAQLSVGAITPKDKKDLAFGVSKDVDIVALSFVQTPKDIANIRRLLKQHKSDALVVAKIETQAAIENLDAIIEASDGIMVARGDLAVEVPKEDVPLIQKRIIRACRALGKPVITATQMLDSMTESPTPTRAEVADVANAVFDGTDAVMLSQESAVGIDPVHTVATMAGIAVRAEQSEFHKEVMEDKRRPNRKLTPTDLTTFSATYAAHNLDAAAIVTLTEGGTTARMCARHRPHVAHLSLTPHARVARQLALSFGVLPVVISPVKGMDDALKIAPKELRAHKYAKNGDTYVLVLGMPFGVTGTTDTCSIQTV